jgi:hypothetical protein
MSINLHLSATKKYKKGKKWQKKNHEFDLCQTPTEVTYSIISHGDSGCEKAYCDWLLGDYINGNCRGLNSHDANEFKKYIENHIGELEEWLTEHEGWDICWYFL